MEEKILDLLAEICEDDIVKEDLKTELFQSGLLDSLGFAELLAGLEEECSVVIAPSEVTREEMDTRRKFWLS
ncbi:MAG: D-alanine--poly(phosphoribitol) ligase subunit 2 [Blautia marasmi]